MGAEPDRYRAPTVREGLAILKRARLIGELRLVYSGQRLRKSRGNGGAVATRRHVDVDDVQAAEEIFSKGASHFHCKRRARHPTAYQTPAAS